MIDFSNITPLDVIEDWGLNYHYGKIIDIIYNGNNLKDDLQMIIYIYNRQRDFHKFIYMKNRTIKVSEVISEWNLSREFADIIDGIFEVITSLQECLLDDAINVLKQQLEKLQ